VRDWLRGAALAPGRALQSPQGAEPTMSQPLSPIRWVPSLYFVQGLQFFVVMLIAGLMFKNMGVANDQIARWTGLLGLAWAFKPLWSPSWSWRAARSDRGGHAVRGALGLALLALALQLPHWFAASIAVLFLLAYASATHDIACDGLYMGALDARQQAAYAGWQGAFFNASKFLTLGGLLVLAGHLERGMGVFNAWSMIFGLLAVCWRCWPPTTPMPCPAALNTEHAELSVAGVARTLREVIADFLRKPGIWLAILFIVLFRFAEGQVQTIGPLFLIEARRGRPGPDHRAGGRHLRHGGHGGLSGGSILGGYFTSWLGLKRAMPLLIIAMAMPNVTFYYLSAGPAPICTSARRWPWRCRLWLRLRRHDPLHHAGGGAGRSRPRTTRWARA
jgi:PAT family beta-lactamase induction signal transducer AmpG